MIQKSRIISAFRLHNYSMFGCIKIAFRIVYIAAKSPLSTNKWIISTLICVFNKSSYTISPIAFYWSIC